jgi:hypothetical protein
LGDCTWLRGGVSGTSRHLETRVPELGDRYGTVRCEMTATNQHDEITARATARIALPVRSP